MYRLVQVQYRAQEGHWRVSMNNDTSDHRLILFVRGTKEDAVRDARAFCQILGFDLPKGRMIELMIHKKDGLIQDRSTYPVENDPPESEG